MKRVGDQGLEIVDAKGAKQQVANGYAGLPNVRDASQQWMRRTDFVVAVGADQEQVSCLGVGCDLFEKF